MRCKLKKDYWIIKFSGQFDKAYYLKQYPDVRKADVDPIEHYILYGWKEGRNPNPSFDTRAYIENNPDVVQARVNPFVHWIRSKKKLDSSSFPYRLDQKNFHFCLETCNNFRNFLVLRGWFFHENKKIINAYVTLGDKITPINFGIERIDVFNDNSELINSKNSGFYTKISTSKNLNKCNLKFVFTLEDLETINFTSNFNRIKYISKLKQLQNLINKERIKKFIWAVKTKNVNLIKSYIKKFFIELNYSKQMADIQNTLFDIDNFISLIASNSTQYNLPAPVDIIIPVFNGFEYITKLLDSLRKNTTPSYRLILIDDCSTDERIWKYLQEISRMHNNIILLKNEQNMGFVKTVNKAAKYVKNHFVILNTDTEVPKRWLERLMKPIFENESIASTTPFSNNATICSFPTPNVYNDLAYNLSVDEIDSIFNLIRDDVLIELPSGVGFCMGINKNVWDKIGSFNEKVFRLGYGEENDWCCRAQKAGYKNVVIPNLFVYHKGSVSFSEKAKKLQEENLQKLIKLHPDYLVKVERFIKEDPLLSIRNTVLILLSIWYSKIKPILIIDHSIGGGANIYRNFLIEDLLRKDIPVFLLVYDNQFYFYNLVFYYKENVVNIFIDEINKLQNFTKIIPIEEIFYNNLVSYPEPLKLLDLLINIIDNTGARLKIYIHDFYPVCPSYTLIDKNGKFCDISENLDYCQSCLKENIFMYKQELIDVKKWRESWNKFMKKANRIIAPSKAALSLIKKVYNVSDDITEVVPPNQAKINFTKKPNIKFDKPRIGIIGAINYQKGQKILLEMVEIAKTQKMDVEFIIIGHITISPLKKYDNLTISGPYKREQLPFLIEKYGVNIVAFLSICPETYSYVVDEAIELNLPICCFNIGAPAERVSKYKFGYIISQINSFQALDEILAFWNKIKKTYNNF